MTGCSRPTPPSTASIRCSVDLIPTMPETRLCPPMQHFSQMLRGLPLFADFFRPV